MPIESAEELIDRQIDEREKKAEELRLRLRTGWKNDETILNEYFVSCVNKWKTYKGDRTPEQVLKLYGIYKQATSGDCNEPEPSNKKSHDGLKWSEWYRYKGMPKNMAKRRFITYIATIDPLLIDILPGEKPPDGFPFDRNGKPICAKCNTVAGCVRPLLDQHGIDIKTQLFESEELQDGEHLRAWAKNALEHQRCVWGVHKPISKAETRPFTAWFNRPENRGFRAYDSLQVMLIVKELLTYQYQLVYDIQLHKNEYSAEDFNKQAFKVQSISRVYTQLSGEEYIFEVPCESKNALCNQRRIADGGKNHSHPVTIDPPTKAEDSTHKDAVELRMQCAALGLNIHIGIEPDIEKRCNIYRQRIIDHYKALEAAKAAKARNEVRAEVHKEEKKKIKYLVSNMNRRQVWDACHSNNTEHLLEIIQRGADPNIESPRGITPLISLVLNNAPSEYYEELVKRKVKLDYVNIYGMTALMYACRLREVKSLHILIRNGCSITTSAKGGPGKGMTALHWCAVHGYEEGATVLLDYIKENGGDSLRTNRMLDAQNVHEQSALMLAAKNRCGLMCKVLTSLGANPNIRDHKGHNAAYLARDKGWTELADWLENKVGGGIAKLETYSDLQYEKKVRYGNLKIKEFIQDFGSSYLALLQSSSNTASSPLGPPSNAIQRLHDWGEVESKSQLAFIDMSYELFTDTNRDLSYTAESEQTRMLINTIKTKLKDMVDLIQKGFTDPNGEALSKPLPWTPLMCAVAINDFRTAKILIREGASINHPNKDGMTALMLAAQLQHMDLLIELLLMGGNLNSTDNFGYTPLAYSSSLPTPTVLAGNVLQFVLEGDTHGVLKMNASGLIKVALQFGVGDLKEDLEMNRQETAEDRIECDLKFLRLLESNGLTRMESCRGLYMQSEGTTWRIPQLMEGPRKYDHYSETSSEARDKEARAKHLASLLEAEKDAKRAEDSKILRCPMCTLLLPCAHFLREESLRKFLKRLDTKDTAAQKAMGSKKMVNSLGIKKIDRGAVVLMESGLNNRNTDRSQDIFFTYHKREMELEMESRLLLEREAAKAKAIEDGTWSLWTDEVGADGVKRLINNETGESWSHHFDATSQMEYYHNELTGQSTWISPIPPSDKDKDKDKDDHKDNQGAVKLIIAPTSSSSTTTTTTHERIERENTENSSTISLKSALKSEPTSTSTTTTTTTTTTVMNKKKKNRRVGFILPDGEIVKHPEATEENEDTQNDVNNESSGSLSLVDNLKEKEKENEKENIYSDSDDDDEQEEQDEEGDEGGGTKKTASQSAALLVGENPVPVQGRSAFMFTSDFFKRPTNGVIGIPSRVSTPKKALKKSKNAELPVPSVQLSGWLFVSLSSVERVTPPVEKLRMSTETWGDLLEHIRKMFIETWAPRCVLEPLPDVRTWKVPPEKRCHICRVGYSRMRREEEEGSSSNADMSQVLCLSCTIRKEIFEKSKLTLPRSFRKDSSKFTWPFRTERDDHSISLTTTTTAATTAAAAAAAAAATTTMLPSINNSPLRSLVLEKIDNLESKLDDGIIINYNDTGSEAGSGSSSRSRSSSINRDDMISIMTPHSSSSSPPSSPMIKFNTKPLKKTSDTFSINTTDSLASLESDPSLDVNKYGIRELQLIPLLIAKGHYNEVERLTRIALYSSIVNEGEGIVYLVKLLNLQAEMYKFMGIYPLAVAILMDCVDLIASLVGYEDASCREAIFKVTEIYRTMKCSAFAKRYITGLSKNLSVVSLNTLKSSYASKLLDTERDNTIKQELNNSSILNDFKRLVPMRKLIRRGFSIHGIGGLWSLFTSCNGYVYASKLSFYEYLNSNNNQQQQQKMSLQISCYEFLLYFFKFRNITDHTGDLYRHLVHQTVQSLLGKHLVKSSELAVTYSKIVNLLSRQSVENFLKFGEHFSIDIFDPIVKYCFESLRLSFRRYVYSSYGRQFRCQFLNAESEGLHINAILIQNTYRMYRAKRLISGKLQAKLSERLTIENNSKLQRERDMKKYLV